MDKYSYIEEKTAYYYTKQFNELYKHKWAIVLTPVKDLPSFLSIEKAPTYYLDNSFLYDNEEEAKIGLAEIKARDKEIKGRIHNANFLEPFQLSRIYDVLKPMSIERAKEIINWKMLEKKRKNENPEWWIFEI